VLSIEYVWGMISRKFGLFMVVLISLLGSCTKNDNFEAIEMSLQCLSAQSPIIIQTQDEYDSAKYYNTFGCDSSSYPEIDFTQYTLIGVERIKNCSSSPVNSEVKLRRGAVTMYFEEQEDGFCQSIEEYSAWYKSTKTDSDKIEFDIDEVR
jgi:hypothetical protein